MALNASTRSAPSSGLNASVKVSGQMTTELSPGARSLTCGKSRLDVLLNPPPGANRGVGRLLVIPATRFRAGPTKGARTVALVNRAVAGHAVAARAAHGSRPMAYIAAGLSRPL